VVGLDYVLLPGERRVGTVAAVGCAWPATCHLTFLTDKWT
jgi:hypothetical protein